MDQAEHVYSFSRYPMPPGHDSTGLHSNTRDRPIKMCPFSSTLMEDTLSRGVALRKEEAMIYVTKTLFILASFCI